MWRIVKRFITLNYSPNEIILRLLYYKYLKGCQNFYFKTKKLAQEDKFHTLHTLVNRYTPPNCLKKETLFLLSRLKYFHLVLIIFTSSAFSSIVVVKLVLSQAVLDISGIKIYNNHKILKFNLLV